MSDLEDETILLIEEPEVYLHPEYQRRMFAAMRRISANNQVIFTTHSPIMVADIWLTESVRQVRLNEAGETAIENVKIENVIDELGIRYEDVLNPSLIVFVEGKNDIKFYEKLGLIHPKLKLIFTDGFRALHYFAFIKIISSEHVSSTFVLLSDSDGETPEVRIKHLEEEIYKQFEVPPPGLKAKVSGNIFVLDEYSIESYFLNPILLKKAFPELETADLELFIGEYRARYEEKLVELKKKSLTLEEFGKYLKPKLIFERVAKQKFEDAYNKFWENQPNFLKIRKEISERCEAMTQAGNNWFDHLLGHYDFSAPELVQKRDQILAKISENSRPETEKEAVINTTA
jgi:putative ATP-dependent endonuclease of the OLD family